jgi:O-antigen/teichoic acid export membrane protein
VTGFGCLQLMQQQAPAKLRAELAMRNTFKHLVSVVGGEAAVRAANFAATLLIARVFGGSVLGAYTACLAVVTVVIMFADSGLQTSAIAELSQGGSTRGEILGRLYLCKTMLIAAAALLLTGIGVWANVAPFMWAIAVWITLRTALQSYSQLQMSVLKACSKANLIGAMQAIHSLLLLIWIWLVHTRGWGIFGLLFGLTAGQTFELAALFLVLTRAGVRPTWPEHLCFWKVITKSAPFGVSYGLANLIVRADTIVLAALVPLSELGNFSAPNALLAMAYVVSWLFGTVVLPEMVRRSPSPESLKSYARTWVRWIAITMTPCTLFAFWAAPKLMTVLYGPAFYRGGALASVMALACPFIFVNSVYTNLAIATNSKAGLMGLFAITAAVAVLLDLVLGRAFGALGVAWAIVIREVGMSGGLWMLTSRASAPVTQLDCGLSS